MNDAVTPVIVDTERRRGFAAHPAGLKYLALTEAWERFSFFGMQTLLMLYLVDQLLLPGHVGQVLGFTAFRAELETVTGPMSATALAAMIFGIYSGLAYLLPVFGGMIGDRWLGQHRMVMTGAVLMAAGHFMMAFEAPFLLALALLVIGCGCLKGNIATQLGRLYGPRDTRRDDGFQIFVLGTNCGVVLAPLVCGTLGELWGWHWGFGAAGVGMLIGLGIYVAGRRHLAPDQVTAAASRSAQPPLTRHDLRVIGALCVMLLVITSFLIPGGQIGIIYPLWIRQFVDRGVGGFEIPVTWFQSATALASLLLPALLLPYWEWRAQRGAAVGNIGKIAWGCGFSTLAFGGLAALAWSAQTGGRVSWLWLLGFHMLYSMGYLFVWPVGLSLFARNAPAAVNSMFIGVYYTAVFLANNTVGWLGRLYERMTPEDFWLLHMAFVLAGLLALLLLRPWLQSVLASERGADRAHD
jgi:proton-dependent oligopeptide transporter, POT family